MSKNALGLNPREQAFVDHYVADPKRVGKTAAIKAGYAERSAYSKASQLLSLVKIQEAIKAAIAASVQRVMIAQDDVLRELIRIGMSDVRGLFTEAGTLLLPVDMPEDLSRAISGIEVVERRVATGENDSKGRPIYETEYVKKIRFWDKPTALKVLAAYVGIATDRQEHTGAGGAPLVAPQIIFKAVMGPGKPVEAIGEG